MRHRPGRRAAAAEGGRDARPEERAAAADPRPVRAAPRGAGPDGRPDRHRAPDGRADDRTDRRRTLGRADGRADERGAGRQAVDDAAGRTDDRAAAQAGAAGTAAGVSRAGLIDDVVDGITGLFRPGGSPSPTAAPSAGVHAVAPAAPAPSSAAPAPGTQDPATAAPATQAPAPTTAPTTASAAQAPATGTPSAGPAAEPPGTPSAKPSSKPSAKPSASPKAGSSPSAATKDPAAGSPTPSGSAPATPTKDPNCLVDTKALNPAGKPADNAILVPDQNWTLQTTRLALNHAVLLGVVNVQTPTGTKRVLKFEVGSVDIENLHMSTLEGNDRTFHVKGAPGSVSTMRSGPVTMYVERLSGHLSKVLGLPIPIDLGELTLTPDGPLPQWLYDLIGQLQLPLWLELTGVTAVQAGQFGGTLTIPGMKLYNDQEPYPGNAK